MYYSYAFSWKLCKCGRELIKILSQHMNSKFIYYNRPENSRNYAETAASQVQISTICQILSVRVSKNEGKTRPKRSWASNF